jgi:hypothetical protein
VLINPNHADAARRALVGETVPSWRTANKRASWKRRPPSPTLQPGADGQLVARMAAGLAGISAQVWPPAVLAAPAEAPAGSASEGNHGLAVCGRKKPLKLDTNFTGSVNSARSQVSRLARRFVTTYSVAAPAFAATSSRSREPSRTDCGMTFITRSAKSLFLSVS